jgi:pyrimidine-nucleoside phosphorylase
MNVPLGYAIGNSLEVIEAIDTLKGKGPKELAELSIALAAEMAALSLGIEFDEAKCRAENVLFSGIAFKKFKEWVSAQGAELEYVESTDKIQKAKFIREVKATSDGYISAMDAEKIGLAAMELGAGRKTKNDEIDFSAGIVLSRKTGEGFKNGDLIATLYTNDEKSIPPAENLFKESLEFSSEAASAEPLIYKTIRE